MALVTTFVSTPLASLLYPPWYQKKLAAWKRGEIDWDTGAPIQGSDSSDGGAAEGKQVDAHRVQRLLVYLRLDSLPAVLGLISLFGILYEVEQPAPATDGTSKAAEEPEKAPRRPVRAHGMRLLQLTDRDSSFMTVAQVNEYTKHDPVVNTFCTVGQLNHLAVSGEVAIMPETRFPEALLAKSSGATSDLLLVPWSETGNIGDSQILSSATAKDKLTLPYADFVRSTLQSADQNVAVFLAQSDALLTPDASSERTRLTRTYSFSAAEHDLPALPPAHRTCHVFLPYLGGADDRLALSIVLQLCERPEVTATVVRLSAHEDAISPAADEEYFNAAMNRAQPEVLARVTSDTIRGSSTVEDILAAAAADLGSAPRDMGRRDIVVVGRHGGAKLDTGKLAPAGEASDCLGVLAAHIVMGGLEGDMLVVQARQPSG